jgi:hypothetical protein
MVSSPRLGFLWVWNVVGLNEGDCVVRSIFVPRRRKATGSWSNIRDERPHNLLLFFRCHCDDHVKKNGKGAWQTRETHTTLQLENLKQNISLKTRKICESWACIKIGFQKVVLWIYLTQTTDNGPVDIFIILGYCSPSLVVCGTTASDVTQYFRITDKSTAPLRKFKNSYSSKKLVIMNLRVT